MLSSYLEVPFADSFALLILFHKHKTMTLLHSIFFDGLGIILTPAHVVDRSGKMKVHEWSDFAPDVFMKAIRQLKQVTGRGS